MLILGLDPGSRHTGYGLIDKQGDRLHVVSHGRFSCPTSQPLAARLRSLSADLDAIIDSAPPEVAVLESLFHGVNSRSLIVLAQARGALLAGLARRGLEVWEYSPAQVKTAVTGNGRADKSQVARMVRLLLGAGAEGFSADATDALALAICAANRHRLDVLERVPAPHR